MNILRERTVVDFAVETVDSVDEARQVLANITTATPKKVRDAANSLVSAFFVSHLREVPKADLLSALEHLKGEFGKYNAFKWAVARVQAFRPKNRAWKTFTA